MTHFGVGVLLHSSHNNIPGNEDSYFVPIYILTTNMTQIPSVPGLLSSLTTVQYGEIGSLISRFRLACVRTYIREKIRLKSTHQGEKQKAHQTNTKAFSNELLREDMFLHPRYSISGTGLDIVPHKAVRGASSSATAH